MFEDDYVTMEDLISDINRAEAYLLKVRDMLEDLRGRMYKKRDQEDDAAMEAKNEYPGD